MSNKAPSMKLLLGGGGSAEQEASVLAHFVSLVPDGGRVLNLPWARPDPGEPSLHEWITGTLGPLGIVGVVTASTVNRSVVDRLSSFDAVFVGGGNTYRLLARLRETGMAAALTEFAQRGRPCYGGSAGAIVFGASIATCAHLDRNEIGLVDLAGLNLCRGRAIWPHHLEEDHERIVAFIEQTELEVLSVPENAGIRVDSETIGSLGDGAVIRWHRTGRERVPSWASA
jgi:dipeptidase E